MIWKDDTFLTIFLHQHLSWHAHV